MATPPPVDGVEPDGHYDGSGVPSHLVSNNEAWWLGLTDDGKLELRHNGHHVGYAVLQ